MIKVVGLKKSYGRLEALKSISFEVEKGSVFGFIGRNGAGKTTTMNILTGLIKFDEGKIFIKGKDFLKNKQENSNLIILKAFDKFEHFYSSFRVKRRCRLI